MSSTRKRATKRLSICESPTKIPNDDSVSLFIHKRLETFTGLYIGTMGFVDLVPGLMRSATKMGRGSRGGQGTKTSDSIRFAPDFFWPIGPDKKLRQVSELHGFLGIYHFRCKFQNVCRNSNEPSRTRNCACSNAASFYCNEINTLSGRAPSFGVANMPKN